MRPELRHRLAMARDAFQQHRHAVYQQTALPLLHRARIFEACVLSTAYYGAGTWTALVAKEKIYFFSGIMRLYRRILAKDVDHEQLQHWTDERVCLHLQLPSPAALLRLHRLRHFGLACRTGNDALWSLIAVEQLWLQEVKADLAWLHSLTVARSTRPAPEDNPDYWHDLILNHTGAWKGLLKKARQHLLAILQREHHIRQWHADLGPILDEAGVSWNQAPDAENLAEQAVHPCLACRTCFLTKAAWSVHAFKIHGRVAPTRHQAEGNVCDACGKLYLSNRRLSLHLAYSDTCWQLLRHRGLCVPPGPGAGSRLNRAQEEDDRCPWLQTMGPRDLRPLDQDRHLTLEQENFMKQVVDLEILHLHAPDAETYPSVEEWTDAFRQQCLLPYLHMDDFKIVFSYYQAEFEDGIPDAGPLRTPYLDFAGALTDYDAPLP